MSRGPATVARLWEHGFPIGPAATEPCPHCGHPWGDHLLHPMDDNPRRGGTWSCPADCPCFGTWDAGAGAQP